jgi:hypothetical protein
MASFSLICINARLIVGARHFLKCCLSTLFELLRASLITEVASERSRHDPLDDPLTWRRSAFGKIKT